MQQRNYRTED